MNAALWHQSAYKTFFTAQYRAKKVLVRLRGSLNIGLVTILTESFSLSRNNAPEPHRN
jgi:hypothetical protein